MQIARAQTYLVLETENSELASTTDKSEIIEMESEEETQESESTSSVSLVTKVNLKAAVWRYFRMETDEHGIVKDLEFGSTYV